MVNGDISEYNILYDGEPWIIDWPQFVPNSHENAKELLQRDISKPATFFKKRFGVETDSESVLSFVTGKSRTLKIFQT